MRKAIVTEMPEDNHLVMTAPNGEEVILPLVAVLTVGGHYYAMTHIEESDEFFVVKMIRQGDKEIIQLIEDQEEFQKVTEAWELMLAEAKQQGILD